MIILITLWYPITVFVHSWYIYVPFFDFQWNRKNKKHGARPVDQTKALQVFTWTPATCLPKAITPYNIDAGSTKHWECPLPFHPHRNLTKHCFVLIYSVLGWGFGVRVGFPLLIGKSVCEEITIDDYCHPFQSITTVDNLQILTTTITYTSH